MASEMAQSFNPKTQLDPGALSPNSLSARPGYLLWPSFGHAAKELSMSWALARFGGVAGLGQAFHL